MSLQDDLEQTGYEFLLAETQMGLTFANLALDNPDDPEKKERNTVNARKAYDTILHLRIGKAYSASQILELDAGLAKIRVALIALGELL